jgi:predicted small secreted protein
MGDLKMKHLLIMIALGTSLILSACNTIEGMGEDIEKAGENLSEGAEKVKKKM